MEYRSFGKTGLKTSLLGFGGFHMLEIPQKEVERLLGMYLDAGGNYIETAREYAQYQEGESERKIGQSVMHRRDDFVLVTKTHARTKKEAAAHLDLSLKNLNTDYIDGLLMHHVSSMEEYNRILEEDGAYQAALDAKKAGKIGFIGISMHGWPGSLIEAAHSGKYDAVMATVNYYDRFNFPEIENTLLPLANQKEMGIILMKALADGYLYKSPENAFRYAFSRPVSVVVAGINNEQMLRDDLRWAEEFTPMTTEEEQSLFADAVELSNYVCRQCGKCACPQGLNIPKLFEMEGTYDRQMARGVVPNAAEYALQERLRFWFGNEERAKSEYAKISPAAGDCTGCGECVPQCPHHIDIPQKMRIVDYKLNERDIF